jgi:hypothetical protein
MHTNDDADLEIPEITDFSGFRRARGPRFPDGFGIRIDGATAYSIRLIPSGKVMARALTTEELWPVILEAIDRGVPARCIVLDAHLETGERYKVGAGRTLEATARGGIGRRGRRRPVRAAS